MQPGTLVADRYRVERIIGRGGMGLVVEATHLQLATKVALKFLAEDLVRDPTAVARFTREARACAQLKSEHICRVLDFGVAGPAPYIAMELLVGTDLARLGKVRTLDASRAALYVAQACAGLAEAHAARIIHRDLKPGNLFLTRRPDGSPLIKILDFGVAKAPITENDVALTASSSAVGSPGFMSPEQLRSSRTVDARADIWSLGIILYKLIAARLPFPADHFADFVHAISSAPMPPLPEAPPELEAIVARCLEKDPARRFPDVDALAEALAPFAALARGSAPVLPVPDVAGSTGEPGNTRTLLGMPSPRELQTAPQEPRPQATIAGTLPPSPRRPATAPTELQPGAIVGEYQLERPIGRGGMGIVYAAIHPLIGKKVAIKVISAELGTDEVVVQRFVQEARAVNQIGHPNIVDVFAFGALHDGRSYFVMELLQGQSLRARMNHTLVPLPEALQILDEIASALEAAHENGIVHRDLKPDNVFLAALRGNQIMIKLLDFGIAKLAAGEGSGVPKTHTGELIGTPAYLSPEQARGKNVDHRTDVYALGCMMFELFTGRLPFIAPSAMDVVLMHMETPPQRPGELRSDLPVQLDLITRRMMDKAPDRRPTLAELRDVFAELVASGAVAIEPGSGSTFRSELARHGSGSRSRKPSANPAPGATAAADSSTTDARRRSPAPTDAPTAIAFTPGPDPITFAAEPRTIERSKPRSRNGLVLAIAVAAILVPVGSVLIASAMRGSGARSEAAQGVPPSKAPAAAALTATAPTATAPPPGSGQAAEAATSATAAPAASAAELASATPPAAAVDEPAARRQIEIRVDVPTARIEVDGAVMPSPRGVAKLALGAGSHLLVVTAPGRIPVRETIDATSATTPLSIRLERMRRGTPTTERSGTSAAGPQRPAKTRQAAPGPNDPRTTKDYTLDPFAP